MRMIENLPERDMKFTGIETRDGIQENQVRMRADGNRLMVEQDGREVVQGQFPEAPTSIQHAMSMTRDLMGDYTDSFLKDYFGAGGITSWGATSTKMEERPVLALANAMAEERILPQEAAEISLQDENAVGTALIRGQGKESSMMLEVVNRRQPEADPTPSAPSIDRRPRLQR